MTTRNPATDAAIRRQAQLTRQLGERGFQTEKPRQRLLELQVYLDKTQFLRFIPGDYPVPQHLIDTYPNLFRPGDRTPAYLRMEYYHPRAEKVVPDTRDQEQGRDLSIHLMKDDPSIKPRVVAYYNVLSLRPCHAIVKTREARGKSYTDNVYVDCAGKGCPHCLQNSPRLAGYMGYVSLSSYYDSMLQALTHEISQFCLCGSMTPLVSTHIRCSSCGHALQEAAIDDFTDTVKSITPATVGKLYEEYPKCPACHAPFDELRSPGAAWLDEVLSCDRCSDPRRCSLYDVDVAILKSGSGATSKLELDRTQFSARGFRVRPLSPDHAALVTTLDFPGELPASLKWTAARLGLRDTDNPFLNDQGKTAPGARPRRTLIRGVKTDPGAPLSLPTDDDIPY